MSCLIVVLLQRLGDVLSDPKLSELLLLHLSILFAAEFEDDILDISNCYFCILRSLCIL